MELSNLRKQNKTYQKYVLHSEHAVAGLKFVHSPKNGIITKEIDDLGNILHVVACV